MHRYPNTIGTCAHCRRPLAEHDRLRVDHGLFFHATCSPPRERERSAASGWAYLLAPAVALLLLLTGLVAAHAANERALRAMAYFYTRPYALRPYTGTPALAGSPNWRPPQYNPTVRGQQNALYWQAYYYSRGLDPYHPRLSLPALPAYQYRRGYR